MTAGEQKIIFGIGQLHRRGTFEILSEVGSVGTIVRTPGNHIFRDMYQSYSARCSVKQGEGKMWGCTAKYKRGVATCTT